MRSLLIMLCFVPLAMMAQNSNRPYSVFGVGDIEHRLFNRTSGMGGAGLATLSSEYIIHNNPASLTGLSKSLLNFEVALNGSTLTYKGKPIDVTDNKSKDFSIERLSLGIKINSFWASNLGFKKFSAVNYLFQSTKPIEGTTQLYQATYDGDGGLHDYYWTHSFSIGKRFSFGVKSSVISGFINETERLIDTANDYAIFTKTKDYMISPRFEIGAIYSLPISSQHFLSIGGKYLPPVNLSSARTVTVTENGKTIVNEDFVKGDYFRLPMQLGAGLGFKNKNGMLISADYEFSDWAKGGVKEVGWSLKNSQKFSAGIELSKRAKNIRGQEYESRFLQFGGYVNQSYLRVRNERINSFGVTAGWGGTLSGRLLYGLALEGGMRGTVKNDLIKENYLGLSFNLSFREFINSKGYRYY